MMERMSEASPRLKARIAGVFYLLTTATGFAEVVRGRLVVYSDAAATATNILAHEPLFRLAFVADLIVNPCFIALTLLFFDLFKPVNRSLSLLAAFFSLVGCAIASLICLFQLAPLIVLGSAHNVSGFNVEQLQALALMFLKLHAQGYNVSLVFFGFYCLLIGYLIFRSTFLPRILGALMAIAGLCYLTSSFATFLSPGVAARLFPYILVPGSVAELSLILWLLVKGVNDQRWKELKRAAVER
ncbi:MAG TPA: DUF4386 domain-containing protein [Candidatus Acidoferrales bacterium]|jgi:hypothetical protein|nr:DUF4386 domain-containing protein [Candidatus Acidoferrales bacterium]